MGLFQGFFHQGGDWCLRYAVRHGSASFISAWPCSSLCPTGPGLELPASQILRSDRRGGSARTRGATHPVRYTLRAETVTDLSQNGYGNLRSKALPVAPEGSILRPRTKDLASKGPRNLRSRGTLPPKKETLYVVRRCTVPPGPGSKDREYRSG